MEKQKDPTEPPTIVLAGARFSLGGLYMTPGARELLQPIEVTLLLNRHARGDWGNCCEEDIDANEDALLTGARIFSVYESHSGERIWVITEADRSATTFLLPSEY